MTSMHEKHFELLDDVNYAADEESNAIAHAKLDGFRLGWSMARRYTDAEYGKFIIMEADLYYADKGINRPMCGGVFLDWEAKVSP